MAQTLHAASAFHADADRDAAHTQNDRPRRLQIASSLGQKSLNRRRLLHPCSPCAALDNVPGDTHDEVRREPVRFERFSLETY
ncbi:MAG: hypothetical protein KGQ60_00470 [Planctomycetes bacterium]|nr:hypothetical protein [Planctomycetota bacterium]